MKSTINKVAVVALLATAASAATSAQALTLGAGSQLTIDQGVLAMDAYGNVTNVSNGSFFAMDGSGDSKVQAAEKNALTMGTSGIIIGATNTANGAIDQGWSFNSATGYHTVKATGITLGAGGLDMSGWNVYWNGGDINMGAGGAWQVLNGGAIDMASSGYTNSTALFTWDGIDGHTYKLDYTATVPSGGFQGVQYALHLEGTVHAVPEASTYGMMLAGLGLVGGMVARRRKLVA